MDKRERAVQLVIRRLAASLYLMTLSESPCQARLVQTPWRDIDLHIYPSTLRVVSATLELPRLGYLRSFNNIPALLACRSHALLFLA